MSELERYQESLKMQNNRHRVEEVNFGEDVPEGVLLTSLDKVVNWMRKSCRSSGLELEAA